LQKSGKDFPSDVGNNFTSCIQHALDPWNPYVLGMGIDGRKVELLGYTSTCNTWLRNKNMMLRRCLQSPHWKGGVRPLFRRNYNFLIVKRS
jgi:hypothetical protein